MPPLEETFAKLLEEAFPDAIYRWKGDDYDVYEVVDAKGLLPVILAQAKKTAAIFTDNLLNELNIQPFAKTLTGNAVITGRTSADASAIVLPFLLDAVYLALDKESEYMSPVIDFDIIDPALEPQLIDALNCSSGEQKAPENYLLPE